MTVLQPVAHWPKIDHAQAAGVWKTVAANLNLTFITIGAFKYPILIIIASPIVADFQYVVYKYFTQIINVTDILLQFFWGRILYSLDYTAQYTKRRMGRTVGKQEHQETDKEKEEKVRQSQTIRNT